MALRVVEAKGGAMSLEIKTLDLIDVELESSFLVLARNMGVRVRVPTFGYLILGGEDPILVDTGASHPEIMERLGMVGWVSEEQKLENQLGRYGVSFDDVRYQVLDYEAQTTGNHSNTKRAEKAAIKKALNSGNFVLPIHDYPARVERGRVVARLRDSVPGPETPVEHRLVSESGIVAGVPAHV
jgi:hypothetical protein